MDNQKETDEYFFDDFRKLFIKSRLDEFFPNYNLPHIRFINAIARFIVYFSLLYFIFTFNIYIFVLAFLLLLGIKLYVQNWRKDVKVDLSNSDPNQIGGRCFKNMNKYLGCNQPNVTNNNICSQSGLLSYNSCNDKFKRDLEPKCLMRGYNDRRLYDSIGKNVYKRNCYFTPIGDQGDFGKFLFKDARCEREDAITKYDKEIIIR